MALLLDLPDLSRDNLVEMSGWGIYREGRDLQRNGAIKQWNWQKPLLTGHVNANGQEFRPTINLKSMTFAENRCQCGVGRRGQFCAHAIAICIAADLASKESPVESPPTSAPTIESVAEKSEQDITLQSIRYADNADTTLSLKLLLPPNFESAAKRNAIIAKIELLVDDQAVVPEKLYRGKTFQIEENQRNALALLEKWGGGELAGLVQLKTMQVGRLIHTLGKGSGSVYSLRNTARSLSEQQLDAQIIPHLKNPSIEPEIQPVQIRRQSAALTSRPRLPSAVENFRQSREARDPSRMEVDGSPHFIAVRLPDRDHPIYRRALDLVRDNGFRSEPSNGRWWLRDQHKTLNFLAQNRALLEGTFNASFTGNFQQRMAAVKELEIRCETKEGGSEFQLQIGLSSDGVDEREVRASIASGRYYLIQSDQIFLINPDKLEKLTESIRALTGNPDAAWSPSLKVPINKAQLNDAEAILEELDANVELPETWKQRSAALREVGHLKAPPLPKGFDDRLRSYQRIGVAWLWHLYQHELGGVLADEMGLGKTIQAIGLMLCAHRNHPKKCALALVVAPASLTSNWAREIQKFAPGLNLFVHHRESRLQNAQETENYDVVITSYATLLRDQELFQNITFPIIIADEAQHIKNRRSQSAQSLRSLNGTGRFVLTGTPIENSLDDLRSIFDFCLPGYLARKPASLKAEEKAWLEQRHQEQAVPYILRRNKSMVAPDLPEKIEQVVYCDLEPAQLKMYRDVQERSARHLQDLQAAGQSENRIRFAALTELLRLRQVCADPGMLNEDYPLEGSAKLQAFAEILDEAMDGDHRILVFSQFVKLLQRLRDWLEEKGVRHLYLDGATRNRLALCDQFNEDEDIPVFLISLKAGGTGLNLTGANTVVHFDPWWNPAVEDQATDRAHRIGQNRIVTSYKLIVSGTVEEKVQVLQEKKSALLRDLLDESVASTAKVSLEDIRELING